MKDSESVARKPPLWGTAIVRYDADSDEYFWDCEIKYGDCDVREPKLTLRAETFSPGTMIEIYEPEEEVR